MNTGKQEKQQWSKKGMIGLGLIACTGLFCALAMAGIIGKEWSEPTAIIVTISFLVILPVGFVLAIKGSKR